VRVGRLIELLFGGGVSEVEQAASVAAEGVEPESWIVDDLRP